MTPRIKITRTILEDAHGSAYLTYEETVQTGALTTDGGLQTFGANDSAGAGYRLVRVPNV